MNIPFLTVQMLQEICIKTSETILSVLVLDTEVRDNAICNPQDYFGSIHRLLSGVLGIVANHNLKLSSSESVADSMRSLETTLGKDCVFVQNSNRLSANEVKALKLFFEWFHVQQLDNINLSNLYELSLIHISEPTRPY